MFLQKLANLLLKESTPTWVGKGTTDQGKRVIESFSQAGHPLPQNSAVTSDTTFVGGKPLGVLNTAKTPLGREFVQTKNLVTNKSETRQTQAGTMPAAGSSFDGKNIRMGVPQTKPMK